ncbi:5-methylcytosine rRNA methyltransferase NSUN4-like [Salmo salar]|uniref:5-cytosine rRNA methyltransferase NSUN4 n=1 Tax=Salmo salar TaxID=8030 RepID=A0A1S3R0L2_SALSA|nr:5-methylcytosine rRNA methyltransferase NSUN4-like [Salmo salar]|eukprot:XP_014045249.1 PREDICTED: 5-methylcytosine rRNA methyltransferase NSUN4-like [Salmo salar]
MSQDRLCSLAMLSNESQLARKLDFEYLISDISSKKARRWALAFQVKLVENNIFKRARTKGRLPLLQTELLLSGIKAVRPGVEVVYSTCSLSQLQNQCMVEQAMHLAREEHGISLQVADLRLLTRLFKDTFQLAPDLHLGQLVLPHLTTNFGPIYMCKLQRLN